jgi:hypothetical protein
MCNFTLKLPKYDLIAKLFRFTGFKVWTYNARGASKPFVLEGYALKVAENKIGE